jgi:hypothetical protein
MVSGHYFELYLYKFKFNAYLLSDFNTMVGYGSCLSNLDILFVMNVMWPLISDLTSPEA